MDTRILSDLYQEVIMRDANKRGTVFRIPSNLDTIVRVYKHEPRDVTLRGMKVTTEALSSVVDGVEVTVWVRVIRPE